MQTLQISCGIFLVAPLLNSQFSSGCRDKIKVSICSIMLQDYCFDLCWISEFYSFFCVFGGSASRFALFF